ncbi:hypothetical protein AB4Y30_11590 [Ornithinibacillus sp. 4-3]|uniref:Phage protein n=1 Tax=Ornithinibacillus sp. 4-3 TaxID=3231488 RepID=A0AB39HLV4_9BACI
MIKDAIRYIKEQLIKPDERIVDIQDANDVDRTFVIDEQGRALEIRPLDNRANYELELNTLTGLVDYIKSNQERNEHPLFIQVINEKKVALVSTLNSEGNRETLVLSHAIVPTFGFDTFYSVEKLIIALQAQFVQTKDRELILQVIGNIQEDNVRGTSDDGVSQAVTVKTGVASAVDVKVPNPVTLAPYRTFLEVEQPESEFIFRMKEGPSAAIFEADGGQWRNHAIQNIHDYLAAELADEIEDKRITIIS